MKSEAEMFESLVKRFWKRVKKGDSEDDCWLWTGSKDWTGYGRFALLGLSGQRSIAAHRFSYELHYGPLPRKMLACHDCPNGSDRRDCVNPRHLFAGDHKANMRDAVEKGRSTRGVKQHDCKLTEGQVLEIAELCKNGELPYYQIAKIFHVDTRTVSRIALRKNWKYLFPGVHTQR